MKYVAVFVIGLLTGAALFVAGLIYSPFRDDVIGSPFSMDDGPVISLNYDGVPRRSIAFTNDGESRLAPHPAGVPKLREASVSQSSALLAVMRDDRGRAAGLGLKFSSPSENTDIVAGQALVDSVWYIYLPGHGSLFIEQSENFWPYLKSVVIPAYRNSVNSWKGNWRGNLTVGPGVRGAARVTGGSGRFTGLETAAVESLTVEAYSADTGPVAASGRLLIRMSAKGQQDARPVD